MVSRIIGCTVSFLNGFWIGVIGFGVMVGVIVAEEQLAQFSILNGVMSSIVASKSVWNQI